MPVQPIVRSDPSGSDSTSPSSIAGPLAALTPHPDASLSVVLDEAILLAALSNGELAVAIHAAGLPPGTAALSTDQIRALAVTGIALLGLAEARRINDESRLVNVAYCTKARDDASADLRAEVTAHHRIWGTWRREQTATDLAYRLSSQQTIAHRLG